MLWLLFLVLRLDRWRGNLCTLRIADFDHPTFPASVCCGLDFALYLSPFEKRATVGDAVLA